jgi:superfamily II DNA helicase RecQ
VTLLLEAEADRPNLELHVTPSPAGLAGLGAADQPSEQRLIQALAQEICSESVPVCQQSVATARHPPRTIVFCITRADAERISSGLARLLPLMTGTAASGGSSGGGRRQVAGRDVASVGVYHSGLSEAARRKAARQWARGITRVLVATPAVGLGASAK